jgi:two-component system sensor histidine kinase YesM
MRCQDKLEYEIVVDELILKVPIVKMVLQPIVENAIYHGIKYKENRGMIRIIGRALETDVIIQVIDNGLGMDEETLRNILVTKRTDESKRVGVLNVQNRLQLYYGKNYGLQYESKEGEGTTVNITIPNQRNV